MGMLPRILRGVGANGYSQLATILIQLASVPLFLSVWPIERYGDWLVISAIPAYLAVTDFGIVMIAANRMTMLIAAGKSELASRVLNSAQAFLAVTCCFVAAASSALLLSPLFSFVDFESRCALLLLIFSLIIGQVGGLAESVFRATNRFAMGIGFGTTARLAEWGGSILALLFGGGFIWIALGALFARGITTIAMVVVSSRLDSQLQYGFALASRRELRKMLRPAGSYMAFSLANALTFQGMTVLAGIFLGPAQVVVFNTYRTLGRLAVQSTSMLSHAVWPEFSRLFGLSDRTTLRRLYRQTSIWGASVAIAVSLCMFFLSPFVLEVWTRGNVEYVSALMLVFVGYATIAGMAHSPRVLLMSTNSHGPLGGWGVALSAVTIGLSTWLVGPLGAAGLAVAMLLGEIVILAVSADLVRRFWSREPSDESLEPRLNNQVTRKSHLLRRARIGRH